MDADIFCIQESKLQEGQIDLELEGYLSIGTMLRKKVIQESYIYKRKAFKCKLWIRDRRA